MIFQGKNPSLNLLQRAFSVNDTHQIAIFKHIDSVYQLRYSLNLLLVLLREQNINRVLNVVLKKHYQVTVGAKLKLRRSNWKINSRFGFLV